MLPGQASISPAPITSSKAASPSDTPFPWLRWLPGGRVMASSNVERGAPTQTGPLMRCSSDSGGLHFQLHKRFL